MADYAFYGMRGTADWTDAAFRPKNWRETVLYLYPNGDTPLTALTSVMKSERTTDPEFYWFTKGLPAQGGVVTNIYTDQEMSEAYAGSGVATNTLYVKTPAETAQHCRAGHVVLLRDASDYSVDVVAKVLAVTVNGANSRITVTLLEADDNSSDGDLSDCDTLLIIGSVNAEGASMPRAVSYDPVKFYNKTQIFRTPLEITRTARKTKLRTYDQYKEAKREALQMHSIEMEKAFLWGIMTEVTGDNGKPERTTKGLINWIREAAANGATISDYTQDDTYSTEAGSGGKTWLERGEAWLDVICEHLFRYGSDERMAYVGSGVLLAINQLVKANSMSRFELNTKSGAFGIKVVEWVTPFGVIYMKRHPLFSYDATTRNTMVVFDPKDLVYRYIDDTTFYGSQENKVSSSGNRVDGTLEEYLTEVGLEFHHPAKCAFLTGFGSANAA